MRRFNLKKSFPRTLLSTLAVVLGLKKSKTQKRFTVFTFSISEDYARLWLYFAKKYLPEERWHFLIIDGSGEMQEKNLPGAEIIKFANLYHGLKIDIFIKKFIGSEIALLSDDDKYIISDLSEPLKELGKENAAAVSLCPRNWYYINLSGKKYLPMGSYSVLMKRSTILKHNLSFKPLKKEFLARSMENNDDFKKPFGYDTADHANESLLKAGYDIITEECGKFISGFDGLSAPRMLLAMMGIDFIKLSLSQANHFKKGSINCSTLRGMYGMIKLEELFKKALKTQPKLETGLTAQEITQMVTNNKNITEEQKKESFAYFSELEQIFNKLAEKL